MVDPVTIACGHTFDRKAITAWFASYPTYSVNTRGSLTTPCPVDKADVKGTLMVRDVALRDEILKSLDAYPILKATLLQNHDYDMLVQLRRDYMSNLIEERKRIPRAPCAGCAVLVRLEKLHKEQAEQDRQEIKTLKEKVDILKEDIDTLRKYIDPLQKENAKFRVDIMKVWQTKEDVIAETGSLHIAPVLSSYLAMTPLNFYFRVIM
jgi:hypothetical protein